MGGWRNTTDTSREIDRQIEIAHPRRDDNKRRHGRLKPGLLKCSLGRILDFSATGLRLQMTHPLEGQHAIVLNGSDKAIQLLATVMWCRKIGFRKYQAGLRFENIDNEAAQAIRAFSLFTG